MNVMIITYSPWPPFSSNCSQCTAWVGGVLEIAKVLPETNYQLSYWSHCQSWCWYWKKWNWQYFVAYLWQTMAKKFFWNCLSRHYKSLTWVRSQTVGRHQSPGCSCSPPKIVPGQILRGLTSSQGQSANQPRSNEKCDFWNGFCSISLSLNYFHNVHSVALTLNKDWTHRRDHDFHALWDSEVRIRDLIRFGAEPRGVGKDHVAQALGNHLKFWAATNWYTMAQTCSK